MTRLVVIIGFVIAFAAGLVVGIAINVPTRGESETTERRSRHGGGWLAAELDLTEQQQEQLKTIWSEVARRGTREQEDRRRQLRRERDEAIAALVGENQREQYEQVLKEYSDRSSAFEREWRDSFANAVERTKALLTPEQRAKYEELLSRHQWDRGSRERDRSGRRENGSEEGSKRPSSSD